MKKKYEKQFHFQWSQNFKMTQLKELKLNHYEITK